jgi:hypothetical protein
MKTDHCLAILVGLCVVVSAKTDAMADCGYTHRLWLWPEGSYCKNYCDFGLCFMRCRRPSSYDALRPCSHPPYPGGALGIPLNPAWW